MRARGLFTLLAALFVLLLLLALTAAALIAPLEGLAAPGEGGNAPGSRLAGAAGPRAVASSYLPVIAFDADRGVGTSEIYLMRADGSYLTRLTNNGADEYNADISPDGTRIAFESNLTGVYQIYVMNTDGSNVQRVTTSNIWDQFPRWSPDGTKLTFSRVVSYPNVSRVCVVNVDGTGSVQLSGSSNIDWGPDWSPDGTKIAFYSYVGGHAQIFTMNTDGSGRQQITSGGSEDRTCPRWSPDGTKFTYSATDADWSPANVHVVNADGTGDVVLTNDAYNNYHPTWSPDGSMIAFSSNRTGIPLIYAMNADGTGLQQLTSSPYSSGDWGPDWGLLPYTASVGDEATHGLTLSLPNPIRAPATIRFTTGREADTELEIFDSAGRLVRTLLRQRLAAGTHSAVWDARDAAGRACPAGVYHCRLTSGGASRAEKLVFVR